MVLKIGTTVLKIHTTLLEIGTTVLEIDTTVLELVQRLSRLLQRLFMMKTTQIFNPSSSRVVKNEGNPSKNIKNTPPKNFRRYRAEKNC